MAGYWDTGGKAPQSASVIVENITYPLPLHLGFASCGTYDTAIAKGTACRTYYFSFKDGKGTTWLYPENGRFATFGEGICAKYYMPPESISTEALVSAKASPFSGAHAVISGGMIFIQVPAAVSPFYETRLTDLSGRVLFRHLWDDREYQPAEAVYRAPVRAGLAPGVYILLNRFRDRHQEALKVVFLP
jgi:hypothetical protein